MFFSDTPTHTNHILLNIILTFLVILVRFLYILHQIQSKRSKLSKYFQYDKDKASLTEKNGDNIVNIKSKKQIKTLVVFGSGGHTSEMLSLLKNISKDRYTPYIAIIANTDTTSKSRILHAAKANSATRIPDIIHTIPRSREVGQSYITSIYTTIKSILYSIYIIGVTLPDVVICNGPGTCLPIIYSTLLYRILGLCYGNVIFIESFCRVQSLSLTGKLVFPIVDRFIVHWDELQQKYPKSELIETFVSKEVSSS